MVDTRHPMSPLHTGFTSVALVVVFCVFIIANHQAVRSKIGGDVADQLQRQLLLDQQKNEVGKLKQDELLSRRELAKGNY